MVSPHRRLSQRQFPPNARYPAHQPGGALRRYPQPLRPSHLQTGPTLDARPARSHHQREKHSWRFLSNPNCDAATQCALIPAIGQLAGLKGRTPIMIDWSDLGRGHNWPPADRHQVGKGGAVNWDDGFHSWCRGKLNRLVRRTKGCRESVPMLAYSPAPACAQWRPKPISTLC